MSAEDKKRFDNSFGIFLLIVLLLVIATVSSALVGGYNFFEDHSKLAEFLKKPRTWLGIGFWIILLGILAQGITKFVLFIVRYFSRPR